ncbi:hypothetical protein AX17_001271 [Amanita inopinata Kibby_2008]|nr:hypothetical protein AX17_001271 [Amanita inopinata Kibby_2008]
MEILSSSNSLYSPLTAVDVSALPRSAAFPSRRTSKSLTSPPKRRHARVSGLNEHARCVDRFSLANSSSGLPPTGRTVVCDFLPLSPITASPICTPTPSLSIQNLESPTVDILTSSPVSTEYMTAPNSPSSFSACMPLPSPTWMSTPPTPPTTQQQHFPSVARSPISSLSASTSFPALMLPHGCTPVQPQVAQAPIPPMAHRVRSLSDSSLQSQQVLGRDSEQHAVPLQSNSSPSHEGNRGSDLRRRAKFHIPRDLSVENDDCAVLADGREHTDHESNLDGHHSNNDTNRYDGTRSKDTIRRFHALKELLMTEVGYLMDLKAFVVVYLHNLCTVSYRVPSLSRAPSSFATGSWMSSYAYSSPCLPLDAGSLHARPMKEYLKGMQRLLFSKNELEILMRNSENILQLHEHFMRTLELIMEPFGTMEVLERETCEPASELLDRLDAAIDAISQGFIKGASSFYIYQEFCAGHSEALDIVRKKQQQHPVEWDAFERHCATAIADQVGSHNVVSAPSTTSPQEMNKALSAVDRGRIASLTSLDGAIRSLRAFASRENPFPQHSEGHDKSSPRLSFTDYMIKPVQRICRYPLLLEQLRPMKTLQGIHSDVDTVVEESVLAMRNVATAVDDARHQKDAAIQTSLIISRILQSATPNCPHVLSHAFLSSLGACLLAGSLDVIHYSLGRPQSIFTNIRAKYLGAFLYAGGYLILVKVLKGKLYEPKHWFRLVDFDIRDIGDTVLLPSSFCLSSNDHLFELAAACPREKNIWLDTIHESLAATWSSLEPVSSLGLKDTKQQCLEDVLEAGFSATRSNSMLRLPDAGLSEAIPTTRTELMRQGMPYRQEESSESDHASSVSIKAIFTLGPELDTITVRHASMAVRQQTDQGLQDILSRVCNDARVHVQGREGRHFQVPRSNGSLFARSNSTVSMAGLARGRLSRRSTVRISRHNSLPSGTNTTARRELMKAKSMIMGRRNLKISHMTISLNEASWPRNCNPAAASSQEMIVSQNVSPVLLPLRTDLKKVRSTILPSVDNPSNGFVRNVKGLFRSRSTSPVNLPPTISQNGEAQIFAAQVSVQRQRSMGNFFKRLSLRAPFYGRACSVSDVCEETRHRGIYKRTESNPTAPPLEPARPPENSHLCSHTTCHMSRSFENVRSMVTLQRLRN